ncbi:MAG: MBL fold metallo-hydrolase [Clostridia bacterium]
MELTVLGCYSPFPRAGGACPGYLIREEDDYLLLECGSGTLSRLAEFIPITKIDNVIISHLHGDHCSDLAILKYAADYDVRADARAARSDTTPQSEPPGQGITVYSPPQPEEEFRRIAYKEALFSRPLLPEDTLTLGPFELSFAETDHPIPCLAMRIRGASATLAYTADTAPSKDVEELARGADLLLAEASLPEGCEGFRGHMTASDAGRMAKGADVARLLLTHFWPEADKERAALDAANQVDIPVEAVVEGRSYLI